MEQLASWRTRKRPRPGHKPPSQAPDTPDCCVPLQLAAGFSPAPILVFQIWATYIARNSFSPLGQPNEKKKKKAGNFAQGDTILITTYHLEQAQGNQIQNGTGWLAWESSVFTSGQLPVPPLWPLLAEYSS